MLRLTAPTAQDRARSAPQIEPISMRISDDCRYTGISCSALYVLIARGQVEIIKLGSSTPVVTENLRQLIADCRRPANNAVAKA